jgi:hypothetical protein
MLTRVKPRVFLKMTEGNKEDSRGMYASQRPQAARSRNPTTIRTIVPADFLQNIM